MTGIRDPQDHTAENYIALRERFERHGLKIYRLVNHRCPNIGMCLCTGCWLKGGALMGKDVIETIHYFSKQKQTL